MIMKRENDVVFTKANSQICSITNIPDVTVEVDVFEKPNNCLKFILIVFFGCWQCLVYGRYLVFGQADGAV